MRLLGGIRVTFLTGLTGLCLAAPAPLYAADHPPLKKHDVTTTDHEELKLDLENPEHRALLIKLFDEGKVEHVVAFKEPNVLELRWDLGLWTIVVFVLLYLILRKAAWGPMLEALRRREETIRGAVDEARIARAETEKVRAEFKAQMDKAYAEIPKMMDEARRDAQQLAEDLRAKAQADIQTERQRLRREIDTATDQALKTLQDFAVNLATRISAKVLKRAISQEDHRRLVDEALAEIRQVGKGA